MSASSQKQTSLDGGAEVQTAAAPETGDPVRDLERLASLVANDEIAWPDDLSANQTAELTADVRRRRRSRLVKLVTRSIAADIARDRSHGGSDDSDEV